MDHTLNLSLILSHQYVSLVVWLLRPMDIYLMVVGKSDIGQKDLQHSQREVTGYDRLGSSFRCNSLLVIHYQMIALVGCLNCVLGRRAEDKVISTGRFGKGHRTTFYKILLSNCTKPRRLNPFALMERQVCLKAKFSKDQDMLASIRCKVIVELINDRQ